MLLMLVIFGKFGSFLGGRGWAGRFMGARRPFYSIFMQLFAEASKQGALYLIMGNNAIGPTFAAGYRIYFFFVFFWKGGGRSRSTPVF